MSDMQHSLQVDPERSLALYYELAGDCLDEVMRRALHGPRWARWYWRRRAKRWAAIRAEIRKDMT